MFFFSDCKYTITESAGAISSPGYPDAYPSNIRCYWEIKAKPEKIIRLIVFVASVGNSTDCSKTDYIQVCQRSK